MVRLGTLGGEGRRRHRAATWVERTAASSWDFGGTRGGRSGRSGASSLRNERSAKSRQLSGGGGASRRTVGRGNFWGENWGESCF
ncbi:hypothetical protein SLA2020_473870 [Shorea laevis]